MKATILSIIFLLGSLLAPSDDLAQGWNFVKEENGIKLYNRSIDGFEFKEVKAILNVDVDIEKAESFLMNPANIEKWMSGCTMSIPKASKGHEKHYYAIFDAPWPISDRDDYGKISITQKTDHKLHIDFKSIPDGTPKVSSMVRVPFSKGHLKIEQHNDQVKTLTYQFLVDRGGSLPNYLRDYLENTSPVKTVEKLKVSLEGL